MNDPFIWTGHVHRARRIPWRRGRRWRRGARPGPGAWVRMRYRRRLAAIERDLTADAPALSSKFAVFNHLTAGERTVGGYGVWFRSQRLGAELVHIRPGFEIEPPKPRSPSYRGIDVTRSGAARLAAAALQYFGAAPAPSDNTLVPTPEDYDYVWKELIRRSVGLDRAGHS